MQSLSHRPPCGNSRHLVEVADTFAVARWARDADVATIARCILGTLKYEPHGAGTTPLRRALESVIGHEQRASSTERAITDALNHGGQPRALNNARRS